MHYFYGQKRNTIKIEKKSPCSKPILGTANKVKTHLFMSKFYSNYNVLCESSNIFVSIYYKHIYSFNLDERSMIIGHISFST